MRKIFQSKSLKNFIVILTGTGLSQFLTLLVTPLLTRYYAPEEFGKLAIFLSFYYVLNTLTTGKYDKTIFLSQGNSNNIRIATSLSFVICCIMSFILFLLTILLYQTKFTSKILGFEIGYAPLLLGPMVLFYGINLILTTNLNISSHYKLISISRILKTTFTLGLSVLFIFGKPDYNSLLISELVGLTASFFFLVRNANIKLWNDELQVSQLRTFARKFKKFPIYNIPSDFMNISSAQFPPFFINVYFGSVVTGHFSLMKRVIDAPVSLLSSSVLEIFRQEASLEYSENGSCRKVFISTSKKLLFISLVPFSLLFFFSPILFTSYLGEGWAEAGYYAQIFSVYYFFKFISSPLSYVFFIAEKQQIDFLLQVYMFLSSLVILNLPNYFSLDEYFVLQTYSTNFVFIYIVYYFISYKYSKNKK